MNNLSNNLSYCESALKLKDNIEMSFLELGKMLYDIREGNLYQPQWESWIEYCYEFKNLSPSSISKLITVYQTFVLKYSFSPAKVIESGGWDTLYSLIPLIDSKDTANEWLTKAKTLTRSDIRKEVKDTNFPELVHCKHKNTYKIEVCEDCNEKWAFE